MCRAAGPTGPLAPLRSCMGLPAQPAPHLAPGGGAITHGLALLGQQLLLGQSQGGAAEG